MRFDENQLRVPVIRVCAERDSNPRRLLVSKVLWTPELSALSSIVREKAPAVVAAEVRLSLSSIDTGQP